MTFWNLESAARNNPKLSAVGKDGAVLWVMAALYAAEQLTDGFVPAAELDRIAEVWNLDPGTIEACMSAMVPSKCGLLDRASGGVMIHDWDDYNPPADQIKRLSAERRRSGRKGAEVRWTGKNPIAPANGTCHMAPANGKGLVGRLEATGSSEGGSTGGLDAGIPKVEPTADDLAAEERKAGATEQWVSFVGKMAGAVESIYQQKHGMTTMASPARLWEVARHLITAVRQDGYTTTRRAEEEIRSILVRYFTDPDPFVADSKHPLCHLTNDRLQRYRRPMAPKVPQQPATQPAAESKS